MGAVIAPEPSSDPLLESWIRAVADAATVADPAASHATAADAADAVAAAGRDLLARWRDPGRRYHDADHLAAVLSGAQSLVEADGSVEGGPGAGIVPAAVRLAAWFHDAVYQGRPGADEEASAALAEQVLPGLGVPDAVVAEVARLVRLTSTHDPAPDDADGALLVDADLAVLAGDPVDYARYTEAVRAEYAFIPDELFRAGRATVLSALLDKPFLYRTAAGRERWEAAARANVGAEIAALRGYPTP